MDKISILYLVVLGVIIGMFLGGIYQAFPKFVWKNPANQVAKVPIDTIKIKHNIVFEKSLSDYKKLKALYGGRLRKEDIFYAMIMNGYYNNDTIYSDLRHALVEIYNLPPKDTLSLHWIKVLDKTHLERGKNVIN